MKQYYFCDNASNEKGIIKGETKKDCLIKFINIASKYDNKFIEDMFDRLRDAEIEFINLDGLKIYE